MRRLLASIGAIVLSPLAAFAAEGAEEKKGMPQLDPSSYPSQIFWLGVFFIAFYLFMKLVAMPRLSKILEARATRISDDLDHATTASGDAEDLKTALDRSLGAAREKSRELLAAAAEEARKAAAARDAALSAELTVKIAKAEAAIGTAKAEAMGSVRQIAAGILNEALPKIASVSAASADIDAAIAQAAGRTV